MTAATITTKRETISERLERLRPLIESTRFALTEDDVRYDYATGRDRYALREQLAAGADSRSGSEIIGARVLAAAAHLH